MWCFAALMFLIVALFTSNEVILIAAAIFAVAGEISIFTSKYFDDVTDEKKGDI